MFDLIEPFLKAGRFGYVRCRHDELNKSAIWSTLTAINAVDGSMSQPQRELALKKIREKAGTTVILLS